jgi:hypothetical protein
MMKSKLERKWWFAASTYLLSILATSYLMNTAGIFPPNNFAQWAIYFICIEALKRGFSFAGWLLVLCLSPSHKVLVRTR